MVAGIWEGTVCPHQATSTVAEAASTIRLPLNKAGCFLATLPSEGLVPGY